MKRALSALGVIGAGLALTAVVGAAQPAPAKCIESTTGCSVTAGGYMTHNGGRSVV